MATKTTQSNDGTMRAVALKHVTELEAALKHSNRWLWKELGTTRSILENELRLWQKDLK